eukprot:Opistho-1_new@28106
MQPPYVREMRLDIAGVAVYRTVDKESGHARWYSTMDGVAEVLILDENVLAASSPYFHLGAVAVSPDGGHFAYACDTVGGGIYTIHIKNLGNLAKAEEIITGAGTTMAWAADNTVLVYTAVDETSRQPLSVRAHTVGDATSATDTLVYEETSKEVKLEVMLTASGEYVVLYRRRGLSSDARVFLTTPAAGGGLSPLETPAWATSITPTLQIEHIPSSTFFEGLHPAGLFFVLTGGEEGEGCEDGCVYMVDPQSSDGGRQLVLHPNGAVIHTIAAYNLFLAAFDVRDTVPGMQTIEYETFESKRVDIPAEFSAGTVVPFGDGYVAAPSVPHVRFYAAAQVLLSSLIAPDTSYTVEQSELFLDETDDLGVLAVHSPADYETRRVNVPTEGTTIPVTIAYKKALLKPSGNPLVLTATGAYGVIDWPRFDARWITMMRRGAVVVIAHVRGGGMGGYSWREAGRDMHKGIAAEDFAAVAQFFANPSNGVGVHTNASKIIVYGRGAGGFLAASLISRWPSSAGVVVADSPFLDITNAMANPARPWTVHNYPEWGDPSDADVYAYQKTYDPYALCGSHHEHPAVMLTAGKNDFEVGYSHAAKMMAKLRTHTSRRRRADGSTPNTPSMALHVTDGGYEPSSNPSTQDARAMMQAFVLDAVAREELCAAATTLSTCNSLPYCAGVNVDGVFTCVFSEAKVTSVAASPSATTQTAEISKATTTAEPSTASSTTTPAAHETTPASSHTPSTYTPEASSHTPAATTTHSTGGVTHTPSTAVSAQTHTGAATDASHPAATTHATTTHSTTTHAATHAATTHAATTHAATTHAATTHAATTHGESAAPATATTGTGPSPSELASETVASVAPTATGKAAPATATGGAIKFHPHVDDPTGALIGFSAIFAGVYHRDDGVRHLPPPKE